MQTLMFCGITIWGTVDSFNKWAKGKGLSKDVLIHTHYIPSSVNDKDALLIIVFFDEAIHPSWVGKQ